MPWFVKVRTLRLKHTNTYKIVPIVAGSDRFLCIFNSFGVAFASGCFKNQFYEEDGMNFLFPELVNFNSNSNTAHSTITAWLRQMLVESTHQTYSEYRVEELPENFTVQCFRVGGISDLAVGGVCAEFLLHNSGHNGEGISTLWKYIGTSFPLCIPGARVLSGWHAPPYDHLGRAPHPASLDPILALGINEGSCNEFIDFLLWLRPGYVSPRMLGRGRLRPFARAMCATLIMYYAESVNAAEVTRVSERMRDGLFHCKLVASRVDADLVLKERSKLVMTKFKVDNLPLTARTDTPEGVAHITGALTMLNSSVALWQSESAARMKELVDKLDASNSEVAQLRIHASNITEVASFDTRNEVAGALFEVAGGAEIALRRRRL